MLRQYRELGWCRFPFDPRLANWLEESRSAIDATLTNPENAEWWRYQDTWFAGVNVLPNDVNGAVGGGPRLAGTAVDFVLETLGFRGIAWDRAQVSVCRAGYPLPMSGESAALYRFRRDRDAAHVDGLLREGPERRRFLKEYHAFILGIPATPYDDGAAPLTVWEGSHKLVGDWFRKTLGTVPHNDWGKIDLTDGYQAVRKQAFETCRRTRISAAPGEAYIVHRHAVHGMAKWEDGAKADPKGRIVVYFRPPTDDLDQWMAP